MPAYASVLSCTASLLSLSLPQLKSGLLRQWLPVHQTVAVLHSELAFIVTASVVVRAVTAAGAVAAAAARAAGGAVAAAVA